MLQRFVEGKISISACLNEKAFQKNLSKAKHGKNIDWDMQEQLMVEQGGNGGLLHVKLICATLKYFIRLFMYFKQFTST
jgi:hypothetical protein